MSGETEAVLKGKLERFKASDSSHLSFNSLLYDFPEIYYSYLPDPNCAPFIDEVIAAYCPEVPEGILELGCGGGKVLASIATSDSASVKKVGVDLHPAMIAFGREQYGDALELQLGDVKDFSYPHQFSLVLCIGTVLQYAYTNADLKRVFGTIASHLAPNGICIIDVKNSAAYLDGGAGLEQYRRDKEVDYGILRGVTRPSYELDLKRQLLKLWVEWQVTHPVQTTFSDYCEYRLIFPQELVWMAESCGFTCLELRDAFKDPSASFSGPRTIFVGKKGSG